MSWLDREWRSYHPCFACHRQVCVLQGNIRERLIWRIKFCPFCGASFSETPIPEDEIEETSS